MLWGENVKRSSIIKAKGIAVVNQRPSRNSIGFCRCTPRICIALTLILIWATGCHWNNLHQPAATLPDNSLQNNNALQTSMLPNRSETGAALSQLEMLLKVEIENKQAGGSTFKQELDGWYRELAPTSTSVLTTETASSTVTASSNEPASSSPVAGNYRWLHIGLEKWLSQPPQHRLPLVSAHHSQNRLIAATAAIGSARYQASNQPQQLVRIITDPTHSTDPSQSIRLRRAAVETLAYQNNPDVVKQLSSLLERYGQWSTPQQKRIYNPQLHAELLRGLSFHISASHDKRFVTALLSPSSEVQIEALQLFSSVGELPEEAVDLIGNPLVPVRIAALQAVAKCRQIDAVDTVLMACQDNDLTVRFAAIDALGHLATKPAVETLQKLLDDETVRIREESVKALALAGDIPSLLAAADDPSWRVRLAAIKALANQPGNKTLAVAGRLLSDASIEVQSQTIQSISHWPLAQSGPLLLTAIDTKTHRTRTEALAALALLWPPAAKFTARRLQQHPAQSVASLRQSWQKDFPSESPRNDRAPPQQTSALPDPALSQQPLFQPPSQQQAALPALPLEPVLPLEAVQRQLELFANSPSSAQRQTAQQALIEFGQQLPASLWQLHTRQSTPLPDQLFGQVLAAALPTFATIEKLNSDRSTIRHQAAYRLAESASQTPLSNLALSRIAVLTRNQTDPLIWYNVMKSLPPQPFDNSTNDPSHNDLFIHPAIELAYAALQIDSGNVQIQACNYLAKHGSPHHAARLMPLLEDVESKVAQSAAAALGECGPLENAQPLQKLLSNRDLPLRVVAAVALAKLGNSDGPAALERASYAIEPAIRRQAATAMGSLADPLYLSILIRMLDDRDGVRQAALNGLVAIAGEDVASKADPPAIGSREKAEHWKAWYEAGGVTVSSRRAGKSPESRVESQEPE